jgi:hypothetical protein
MESWLGTFSDCTIAAAPRALAPAVATHYTFRVRAPAILLRSSICMPARKLHPLIALRTPARVDISRGEHMLNRIVVAAIAAGVAVPALAGVANPIPEPGVLELLAVGAVAGAIVWARNRRK